MQRLKAVARCPTEASTSSLLAQERDGPQTPNMQSHRGGWAGSERGANRLESSSSSRSYRQERTRGRTRSHPFPLPATLFFYPIQSKFHPCSPGLEQILPPHWFSYPKSCLFQSLYHSNHTCRSKAQGLWVCPFLAQKHSLAPLHVQLLVWTPKPGMSDLHDQNPLQHLLMF